MAYIENNGAWWMCNAEFPRQMDGVAMIVLGKVDNDEEQQGQLLIMSSCITQMGPFTMGNNFDYCSASVT